MKLTERPSWSTTTDEPFVSCLLPTRDRPEFIRHALQCFLAQSYQRSELIVLDDGEVSVAQLCTNLDRVRYVRFDDPISLGRKLNVGVEVSSGAVIQKLDDDDYYNPEFVRCAVEHLPANIDGGMLLAWDCFLVLLAGDTEQAVRYSGHGWEAGGTLCFHRDLWKDRGFRDLSLAEDWWFVRDHASRLVKICAPLLYVHVRHRRNTWKELAAGVAVDEHVRTLPLYANAVDHVLPRRYQDFYRAVWRNAI